MRIARIARKTTSSCTVRRGAEALLGACTGEIGSRFEAYRRITVPRHWGSGTLYVIFGVLRRFLTAANRIFHAENSGVQWVTELGLL